PKNPLVVWVGTGENNSQRSVSYGDGVYKSVDGGVNWQRMGLEKSEHIAKIVIDPRDSNVVYVAAQGPLWGPGGDRGLYKTLDGGATWERILEIDDDTGVTDLVMDPRNPDILVAAAYQRRRRVWTLIDGGPGSALYRSNDAGATWDKLENGLPKTDMGRIGLARSPAAPDIIYALVEAAGDEGGFYRSTDGGMNWEKRGDYQSSSPQYYQEIVADPVEVDRVYSMDTWMMVTRDGGKSFSKVGEKWKHVDNHVLIIDPADTTHLLAGCDGGIYESFDRGATWSFLDNLPVTQFYRGSVDNALPFYNVYGGTQDNATLGGPSRTTSGAGIFNQDWFVTVFGDGFKTQIDPENPRIVYSQYQYGGLVRFDRDNGEIVDIQPQPAAGENGLRWHWNSPLIISPHSAARLYFASNILYRSDDRGASWRPVSQDLTRNLDRNRLKVMGKVQSVDAVAKNTSTSFYGSVVSLSESPLVEGLLYAGTDDGLIQVTEDGGQTWRRVESFSGVPGSTYVSDLEASVTDADTVYATFDNHKNADFAPYVLVSSNRGRTWRSISGDLPERGSVHSLAQDGEQPDLLFAGTEFGLFFTLDGGDKWIQVKGGLPVIAVRDLEIQRRENDLVLATFGRGFYILDDYTPLRGLTRETLETDAVLFPVKDSWMYMPRFRYGIPGKAMQGDGFYMAANPPFGAVFTYYLKEKLSTREEQRQEMEKETGESGGELTYPSWDELRAEDREEEPAVILTVRDEDGQVVRRLTGPVSTGFHRVAWDLRYPAADPVSLEPPPADPAPWDEPPQGPMAMPGMYSVSIATRIDGKITSVAGSMSFKTVPLATATVPEEDRAALAAFQKDVAALQRAVLGSVRAMGEAGTRIDHLKKGIAETPAAGDDMDRRVRALDVRLKDLRVEFRGDSTITSRSEPTAPSLVGRVGRVVSGAWNITSAPTATQR
ncbi:MAG: glycosyl hydrolase, partial [Acidobacteria bacterium]|nr:glycosyl hydrolase [Acidobacteriota bacterium]